MISERLGTVSEYADRLLDWVRQGTVSQETRFRGQKSILVSEKMK